jgi:hypothetical protein
MRLMNAKKGANYEEDIDYAFTGPYGFVCLYTNAYSASNFWA